MIGWKTVGRLLTKTKYDDIFNADETGLFYKLNPDKTLRFMGETCSSGKMSKERITVLIAANLLGTEKRKLLIIGKTKHPRCFKNIKQLPVNNKSNMNCENGMTNCIVRKEE
ncbi:DDE superfamily endonuclease [Popillia japonica]|uniref:DDE superfamily endonuclease n=1 Tax=Popillia japonica TaxID=7064 RepID=A0AAW1LXH1_POPJA